MQTEIVQIDTHTPIIFKWDDTIVPIADIVWFRNFLENQLQAGIGYKHGQTIQLGWGLLRLQDDFAGALELQEPDFRSLPIQWISGVNNTLKQLRRQKDVVESLDVFTEPEFASLRHATLACRHISNINDLILTRLSPQISFSGWTVCCSFCAGVQNEMRLISLYELILITPLLIPFLALPIGYSVIFANSNFQLTKEGKEMKFAKKTFLGILKDSWTRIR